MCGKKATIIKSRNPVKYQKNSRLAAIQITVGDARHKIRFLTEKRCA